MSTQAKTWACRSVVSCVLQTCVSCFIRVSRFADNPPLSTKGSSCPKKYVYRSVVICQASCCVSQEEFLFPHHKPSRSAKYSWGPWWKWKLSLSAIFPHHSKKVAQDASEMLLLRCLFFTMLDTRKSSATNTLFL